MTGPLAQIIALEAYGNIYLSTGAISPNFSSENTTFQFCNKVDFREITNKSFFKSSKEKIVAENPTEWFNYLKTDGCKGLRLYFESSKEPKIAKDHKLAGLIGGGVTWLIEALYNNYSNYWANCWEVTNQNDVNRKIWTVNYKLGLKTLRTRNLQINQQQIKDKLRQTLTEIAEFAYKHNLQSWGGQFDLAKRVLDSSTPEENYYHKDLLPTDSYSLTARQIIFSAGSAWVFGGMGSWNDLGFESKEDNEIYDRLSERLYSNINEAIIAGINIC